MGCPKTPLQLFKFVHLHVVSAMLFMAFNGHFVYSTDNYFTTNAQSFDSVPTTVKTYENETVLLPCYSVRKYTNFFFIIKNDNKTA